MPDPEPNDETDEEKEILKKLLENLLGPVFDKVLRIISGFHENLARTKIGSIAIRHGVFGPYPENHDRTVIHWVAKKLSSLGVAALTGDGYYLPNDPDTLHSLGDISPPIIRELFRGSPRIPEYKYFYIFPRLVSKAAFYMNDERGQTHELRGCYEARIPFVGFIIHEEITRGERDCGYLRRRNGYVECVVPDIEFCSGAMPRRPFCPFYDSIDISWLTKQLFLEKRGGYRQNRLIAVQRLEDLEEMLGTCIAE